MQRITLQPIHCAPCGACHPLHHVFHARDKGAVASLSVENDLVGSIGIQCGEACAPEFLKIVSNVIAQKCDSRRIQQHHLLLEVTNEAACFVGIEATTLQAYDDDGDFNARRFKQLKKAPPAA